MTLPLSPGRASKSWTWLFAFVVAGSAAWAYAQNVDNPPAAKAARVRMEYLSQEVQADNVVNTLNDLDAQGWEVIQIIPVWTIRNENAESALVPKMYQVFGKRPTNAK